jgi:hypothetical protein
VKKAVVGNDIDLDQLISNYENAEIRVDEFTREFAKPLLDLVPDALITEDLRECFDYVDAIKTGTITQPHLVDCFEVHTPENNIIEKDILEKGTIATKEEVIEAVKKITDIKQFKGKVDPQAFIDTLTAPGIEMTRLDAKFIAQMNKTPDATNTDAKQFMKKLGYLMPPEDELLALKKAIVANEMDLDKLCAGGEADFVKAMSV